MTVYNYDFSKTDRPSHLESGEAQIGVSFGKRRPGRELKDGKPITINGRAFRYVLYRKGDPGLEEFEGLAFYAAAQTHQDDWTYSVSLSSALDPPEEHEQLFWEVMESFRVGT